MKHLLLFGFLFSVCATGFARQLNFPLKAGKVHFEVVDSAFRDKTKAQLYGMSKLWLLDEFYEVKQVLEIDDPESGLIAGRIRLPYSFRISGVDYKCSFSFTILSKDGRYKAQLYNIMMTYTSPDYQENRPLEFFLTPAVMERDTKKVLPALETQLGGLMRSLQLHMESIYGVMDF